MSDDPCNRIHESDKDPPIVLKTVKGYRKDIELSVYDQFVNNIMKNGEKSKAKRILDQALFTLSGLVTKENAGKGEFEESIKGFEILIEQVLP